MKTLYNFLFLRLLIWSTILIFGFQSAINAQPTTRPRSPNGLYMRAPDTIPGTIPEMRDPLFWISRMQNPDNVIMTIDQIKSRNDEFQKRMNNFSQLDSNLKKQINQELTSRPGLLSSVPDLNTLSGEAISKLTSEMIGKEITLLTRRRFGNILGNEYSAQEKKKIEDEMAAPSIPLQIKPQTGITVKTSRLRIIPEVRFEYVGYTGLAAWDMWNFDIIPIATKVQILHISKSGGYMFVLSEKGLGWVNSEEIALGTQNEIIKITDSRDFVICTGDRVPFYSDSDCKIVSGWFRMGDRLPLNGKNARIIQAPSRLMNGKLLVQDVWLSSDADVSKGYLPYTTRNIVNQAFKLLDNIYDWTGGWYGRDHATQLRDIYAVFGFKLPSMGGALSAYNSKSKFTYPREGKEVQYKAIMANDPFTTLQICSSGHSQLYLGTYNGTPMVFDTHGYRYNDKNGNELLIRRANVGTINFPDYFLKEYFTFVELK